LDVKLTALLRTKITVEKWKQVKTRFSLISSDEGYGFRRGFADNNYDEMMMMQPMIQITEQRETKPTGCTRDAPKLQDTLWPKPHEWRELC
jgi:hypothetical protein